MYYEEDFVLESRRRRRGNRNFICECEDVRDIYEEDCGCGCGCDHDDEMDFERPHHCHGSCACRQLRNLSRNDVVLFSTGDATALLTAVFNNFDERSGCVTFRLGTADVFVDCKDIKVLVVA